MEKRKIEVKIHCAQGLRAGDSNGLSDPYVKIRTAPMQPGAKPDKKPITLGKTKIKEKTISPVWNETFLVEFEGDELYFHIFDYDFLAPQDDWLGQTVINIHHVRPRSPLWLPISYAPPGPQKPRPHVVIQGWILFEILSGIPDLWQPVPFEQPEWQEFPTGRFLQYLPTMVDSRHVQASLHQLIVEPTDRSSKLILQFKGRNTMESKLKSDQLATRLAGSESLNNNFFLQLPSGLDCCICIAPDAKRDTKIRKAAAVVQINRDEEPEFQEIFFTVVLETHSLPTQSLISYFCTFAQHALQDLPDTHFSLSTATKWSVTLPPLFYSDNIEDKDCSACFEPIWAEKFDATILFIRFLSEESAQNYFDQKGRLNEQRIEMNLPRMGGILVPVTSWELKLVHSNNYYFIVHVEGATSKGGIMFDLTYRSSSTKLLQFMPQIIQQLYCGSLDARFKVAWKKCNQPLLSVHQRIDVAEKAKLEKTVASMVLQ